MAQDSAPWDGKTTGDVYSVTKWKAPYTDTRWSNIMEFLLASSYNGGYVLPAYGNNLAVISSSPASMTIHLSTGAAFVKGRLYENTADKSLIVAANTNVNPRIDRVVLRVDFAAQTIESAIIQGPATALPAPPKLTQDDDIFETTLAYVWVASGAASIANEDIHDERIFAANSADALYSASRANKLRNSEFMAYSALRTSPTTAAPEMWVLESTPSGIIHYTKPTQMSRGRAVQITADGANEGISQTVMVKASTAYAFKVLVRTDTGSSGSVVITTNSAAPTTITRSIKRAEHWITETIFYTTENDASTLTVKLCATGAGEIMQYGQALLVEGFSPGPFRQSHELLTFSLGITDPLWNGISPLPPSSSQSTEVYFDLHFGKVILQGTKAIWTRLELTDSTASSVLSSLWLQGTASLILQPDSGLPNATHVLEGWVVPYKNLGYDLKVFARKTPADQAPITTVIRLLGIQT